MANLDRIIADLMAGATRNGANVDLYRDGDGMEQKLASNYGGMGGAIGSLAGLTLGMPGAGGMAGAAVGADPGMGLRAAAGAGAGGLVGSMAGRGLGGLTKNPFVAEALQQLLGAGGAAVGGHLGGKNPGMQLPQPPQPTEALQGLQEAEETGVKDACVQFGIIPAKFAQIGGGGLLNRLTPYAIPSLIGAIPGALSGAMSAGEGHRRGGALRGGLVGAVAGPLGALLGGGAGMAGGGALGGVDSALLGALGGGAAGAGLAGALGGSHAGHRLKHRYDADAALREKLDAAAALEPSAEAGVKDACARFGIKQAFLGALAPVAGSLVAGPLARAGLGKVAPRLAAGLGTGFKGQVFDGAASLAGQALGSRLGGE